MQDTVSDVYLIFTKICKVGIIIQSHQMRKAKLVEHKYLSLGPIISK